LKATTFLGLGHSGRATPTFDVHFFLITYYTAAAGILERKYKNFLQEKAVEATKQEKERKEEKT
jgi:hypothetical protein